MKLVTKVYLLDREHKTEERDKIKYRANPKIYLFLIKKMDPITNTRQSPPPPLIIPILKQGLQRSHIEKTKKIMDSQTEKVSC